MLHIGAAHSPGSGTASSTGARSLLGEPDPALWEQQGSRSLRPFPPPTRGPAPKRAGFGSQGARAELLQDARKGARPRWPPPPLFAAHGRNPSPGLLRLRGSVVVMDSPWDELTLAFSRTSMFPFFDIAHYLVSVMALKRQPGECGEPQTGPLGVPLTERTA